MNKGNPVLIISGNAWRNVVYYFIPNFFLTRGNMSSEGG